MAATSLPLGDVSFYWRMHDRAEDDEGGIPAFLPFEFGIEPALQLVIQRRNVEVLGWLEKVYQRDANVGYLQEGHALAQSYGGDFLAFVSRVAASRSLASALEIGCGGGYLLRKLREAGMRVTGVDPSPVAVRALESVGIPCIPSFYPPKSPLPAADLILHYDVLEHVSDPVSFLRSHADHLTRHGVIIVAVPDCTASIACGDISIAIHEHLNYFDEDSLARTVEAAGFEPVVLERSGHGAVLYCAAIVAPVWRSMRRPDQGSAAAKFNLYASRARAAMENLAAYSRPLIGRSDRSIGFYVPIRAITYLSSLGMLGGMRFFDDDPGIRGKFFSGFASPVENMDDLAKRPVTDLVIMSLAFGDAIATKVRARLSNSPRLATLKEILAA